MGRTSTLPAVRSGSADVAPNGAPVVVLGVSRSGTTLLKEMLDRHSQLAIPSESYFIPQLWDRHGDRPDREAFVDDLGRLARVREWGVPPGEVCRRLPPRPSFADAVQAIYRIYAEGRGKPRFGDKTPAYMQRLPLLERAFPRAQYVHIVRDGRDACLSFLGMRRQPRFNWARPRGVGSFACQWELEIGHARRLGEALGASRYLEVRYEDLVLDPERWLRRTCAFLGLEFEPAMLEYHRDVESARLLDHPKLAEPPTPGLRRWRQQMAPRDVELFEAVSGRVLDAYGYERVYPKPSAAARAWAAFECAAFRARVLSWHLSLAVVRRSAVWRVRQLYIRRATRGAEGSSTRSRRIAGHLPRRSPRRASRPG